MIDDFDWRLIVGGYALHMALVAVMATADGHVRWFAVFRLVVIVVGHVQ